MSENNGPVRNIVDRHAIEDGWTVITLVCGHKFTVRGHDELTAMQCWTCEDDGDVDGEMLEMPKAMS